MESTSALAAELQVNCEGIDEKQAMLAKLRMEREKAEPTNRLQIDEQITALTDELARLRANHQRLCHALQVLCSEPNAENQPPESETDPLPGSDNENTISNYLMASAVRESISTAALVASSNKSINTAIVSGVAMVPAAAVFFTTIDDGVSEAVKAAALPALVGVGAIVARHFIA